MRTFIAITLPKEIKDRLSAIQEELKNTGAEVKWVKPENIHLTLKFLGEIDEKKLEKIIQATEEAVKDKKPFLAHLGSIGAFPNINFPRVIWLGIEAGDRETKEIAKGLEDKIAKLGIPKEDRPFSSHITIGRTKSGIHRDKLVGTLKKIADDFGKENLEFQVKAITLFKSTLTPKGPIYQALKEANLKTS